MLEVPYLISGNKPSNWKRKLPHSPLLLYLMFRSNCSQLAAAHLALISERCLQLATLDLSYVCRIFFRLQHCSWSFFTFVASSVFGQKFCLQIEVQRSRTRWT